MPDRNWRIVSVFGLAFLIFALATIALGTLDSYKTENRVARDDKSKADAAYARQQVESECIRIAGAVSAECAADAQKAADHAAKPNQDLKAQQDMAQWAYLAAWIAIVVAIITGAGVVYVAMTLNETRKATAAANKAADAAVKANEGFERSSKRELRAYVWAETVTADAKEPIVRIRWKNAGQTPTRDVELFCKLTISTVSQPIHLAKADKQKAMANIGPQGGWTTKVSVPQKLLDSLPVIEGEKRWVIIYGHLTYRDVFDDPHQTDFEFLVDVSTGWPTNKEVILSSRNNYIG